MALNNFFKNYEASGEQRLIEDLVLESIQIYGQEVNYLPRNYVATDQLFTEDNLSTFEYARPIEMYIKDVEGFTGEGDFLSRFGLEIRDRMTLTVSIRRFQEEITREFAGITRPREGDLIFLPFIKGSLPNAHGALYEIKHCEHEPVFYQMNELQMFDITVEKWAYSNEELNTGVDDIDNVEEQESQVWTLEQAYITMEDGLNFALEDGQVLITDAYDKRTVDLDDDSTFFQQEADGFIDFSDRDPFSEGNI